MSCKHLRGIISLSDVDQRISALSQARVLGVNFDLSLEPDSQVQPCALDLKNA